MIGTDLVLLAAVDWIWLARAAPGAAMLGIFGGLALLLIRRGRTFRCPSCRREVSRSAIRKEEILCPRCGWHAVLVGPEEEGTETGPMPADAAVEDGCRYCGRALAGETPVRLWDGHDYCRACADGACPSLAEHAAQIDRLEETMPHSAWKVARRYFLLIGIPLLSLFGVPLFFHGVAQGGIIQGLESVAVISLIFGPIVLLFAAAAGFGFANRRPAVSVGNGQLEVRTGDVWSATYRLGDCEWLFGSISQMNLLGKAHPMIGGPAVVIALPREQGEMYDKLVAVGFCDETRRRWAAFLTLAGVARRTASEKRLPLWRKALNVLAAVVLVPGVFVGCIVIARPIGDAMARLTGDTDLGLVVSVLCVVPWGIYACFRIGLAWPWTAKKRVPSRRSLAHQKKVRLQFVVRFVGISALVTIGCAMRPGVSLAARLAAVILGPLSGWLAGRDLGKRWAGMEWETVERDSEEHKSDG
jgi:DNA-directed RNA polymerase subunit RPC12/RpoP